MSETINFQLFHALGYNGTIKNSTIIHPNLKNYLYIAGSVIVIAELNDASTQEFLNGHDDEVTCLTINNDGSLIASGQKGVNSDLIIWDFEMRKIKFKLSEHDFRIDIVKFSQDNKLLYSSGNYEDKKLIIWDVSSGYIVSNCNLFPIRTISMSWGYKVRDNRNNLTDIYQFANCGENKIVIWELDPYKGEIDFKEIQTGNFSREYISVAFSLNEEKFLYAGTNSGDIVCFLVKTKMIVFSKIICALGITSIIPLTPEQIIIGGGDGTLSLCYINEPLCDILSSTKLFGKVYSISPTQDGVQLLASTDKGFIYRLRALDLSMILLNENHTKEVISMTTEFNNTFNQPYDYLNNKLNTESNQGTYFKSKLKIGTTSGDGTIRLWDLSDYSVYFRLYLNSNIQPTCISFTQDCLYSGWNDGKLRTYQISNSKGITLINIYYNIIISFII
jgi:cilia- and flagella-associated protein 52